MAYVIERVIKSGETRYTGMYWAANGKAKAAGTFDTHERAIEVALEEEAHARGLLEETTPARKATMTIQEFGEERFLKHHHSSLNTRQNYGYTLKNHAFPYIGRQRISEVNRETFYNLLWKVLPDEAGACASPVSIRATKVALSSLMQMALDEGYRNNNPLRTIKVPTQPTKPVLVANHDQWMRMEKGLKFFPPAQLYARVNITTWARRCEMIGFRPCDFDFKNHRILIARSVVYLTSKYHPSGKAGWLVKPNPKNGDLRGFTLSKQLCTSVQEHIEEYGIDDEEPIFPHWMFAYRRSEFEQAKAIEVEKLPPLMTPTGVVHEHGTMGARFGLNCKCHHCKQFAATYQREYRRKRAMEREAQDKLLKTNTWRRDENSFLKPEIWGRFWHEGREFAELPEAFGPYNARHTGISWAIASGIDLQKVRQRAGHGSLEVTSRYAAIIDEGDTSIADSFESTFSQFES